MAMKDLLLLFNRMVKDARTYYFSELSELLPRFLFKTVDWLVNPASPCASVDCNADSEIFYCTLLERWS